MNTNLTAQAADTNDEQLATLITADGDKHPCNCSEGCPGLTTRIFSQGHDARMVTRLRNAVQANEMTLSDAFAEVTKRGGTDRLQIKLDAAVANARKPKAKKARKSAKVLDTFQLGEFTLAAMPLATEVHVAAKVGRWERRGEIQTYQIVEDGKISKGDTVLVFEFEDKKGERQMTLSYSRLSVAGESAEEVTDYPEPEQAFAAEVLNADLSDIPF